MKYLLPALLACLSASPALAENPSAETTLSYLITGNTPEFRTAFPSQNGMDEIEYTDTGWIHRGDRVTEFLVDTSDPCLPAVTIKEGEEGRMELDMSRFLGAVDVFGYEAPAVMMFASGQCAVIGRSNDSDEGDDLCGALSFSGNIFNFHMSLMKTTPSTDYDRFDAALRNETLRLAGEFYKAEYCTPEVAF